MSEPKEEVMGAFNLIGPMIKDILAGPKGGEHDKVMEVIVDEAKPVEEAVEEPFEDIKEVADSRL